MSGFLNRVSEVRILSGAPSVTSGIRRTATAMRFLTDSRMTAGVRQLPHRAPGWGTRRAQTRTPGKHVGVGTAGLVSSVFSSSVRSGWGLASNCDAGGIRAALPMTTAPSQGES
jgi:hypothetical protein